MTAPQGMTAEEVIRRLQARVSAANEFKSEHECEQCKEYPCSDFWEAVQISQDTQNAISLIQSQAAELAGLRAGAKEIEKATAKECAEIAEANENLYTRNLIRTRFNLEDQP